MSKYTQHLSPKGPTPQTEAIPTREAEMAPNNAGGFTFEVGDFERLRRFLILGTEGGTYYCSESKATKDNAAVVVRCLSKDPVETLNQIAEVSSRGLALKNSPAIVALALASFHGSRETKEDAYALVPQVCRTSSHLFEFVEIRKALGGTGSGFMKAIRRWYLQYEAE